MNIISFKSNNFMRILILILILSCSSVFVQDDKIVSLWRGKHQSEIIEKLGPYNKTVEVITDDGGYILIWEASKESIFIPIENIGSKSDKKGTSVSSFHVYVDDDGYIINIKKSVY